MSASTWIKEAGTGRFYVNWKNEYGENERRYSEELSGGQSASQSTYRQDDQTPRSESSNRGADRSGYDTGSSRYSTTQRPRRESISFGSTAQLATDHIGRSEPVKIYNESRSGYHRSGGYDEDTRLRTERTDSPPLSESSQTNRRYQVSSRTRDRDHDLGHDEVDDLSIGVGKVTIDDLVGSPRYTTISASAPTRGGQWGHTPSRRETSRQPIYEDDREPEPVLGIRSPLQQDNMKVDYKGKAITMAQPDPPTATTGKRHITGTEGDVEPLDESYKVRNLDWKKFFRPGRVFSTLWTDAYAGTTNDSENNQFMSSVSYVIYKERVHSKIRRFVVVRLGDRCCTCLPVTTYDGRGYLKRGINLNEHGLIYSSEKKPAAVKGIDKSPLKVKLSKGAERLNNPSYINYGRVYTVETNVKVKDVGELESESRKYLRAYYNQVNTLLDDDDGPGPARTPLARAVELAGVGGGIAGAPYSSPAGTQPNFSYNPSMRGTYGTSGTTDHPSTYNQYPGNLWTPLATQFPTQPIAHSGFSQYNPAGSTSANTIRYSAAPTFDTTMGRTVSSSNHPPPDSRYNPNPLPMPSTPMYPSSTDSHGPSDSRQTYRTVASTSSYFTNTVPATSSFYPRQDFDDRPDERSIGQPFDSRRVPLEARTSRDSYGSNTLPGDRQTSWVSSQAPTSRANTTFVEPPYSDPQYGDRNIDLPTLEEAQASRQRRDSASGRSGGRERDGRSDRHRRR